MTEQTHEPITEGQVRYAHSRALVELRIAELIEVLGRHEADRANWSHWSVLTDVDQRLGEAIALLESGLRRVD
jgi:hypothetical protein